MFAVLNLNKPQGMTSHDVVNRVRRVFGMKKVGHAGTLDPMGEGVLPVCLGQATRLLEYFATDKRYRIEVTFGITTTTLDADGEEVSVIPCSNLTREALAAALTPFKGTFEQKIPMHAAKRVGGKKLYELARQGIVIEAPHKTVTVYSIDLVEVHGQDSEHPVAILEVHCGSGTYMRAIARDWGEALGCGAHMSRLVRTAHGRFDLADAIPLDVLEAGPNPGQYGLDPLPYMDLPEIVLDSDVTASRLRNGMNVPLETLPDSARKMRDKDLCKLTLNHRLVAVAQWSRRQLRPEKVFQPLAVCEPVS